MTSTTQKTPKSPRYSLPWAINKMLILLEKEGIHPVAPDIMAQHLGYTNARNGRAATVLATLRMYGLLLKAQNRKDVISEDIKKFKFTPYEEEKHELSNKWLKSPKLFDTVLSKYPTNLPSNPALRYELIQELNFTEEAANKFIKTLKESIDFVNSFIVSEERAVSEEEAVSEEAEVPNDPGEHTQITEPDVEAQPLRPALLSNDSFSVQITGPGMNSIIEINEEEDLMIVEAMLKKVSKKVFSGSKEN